MAVLGSFTALWNAYPDYGNYPDPAAVKRLIGGAAGGDWITNTCALRLSRALNYTTVPVPRRFAGLTTVKGGDGKRYAFRVRELHKWLDVQLGKPSFDVKKHRGEPFDKTPLASLKGIIGFDIEFSDATGHFDLWDGDAFSSEYETSVDYWLAATRIWLWKAR